MKKPDEWLFQPSWLNFTNKLLKWVRLRAYLAITTKCKLRLRVTRLGRPDHKDKKF